MQLLDSGVSLGVCVCVHLVTSYYAAGSRVSLELECLHVHMSSDKPWSHSKRTDGAHDEVTLSSCFQDNFLNGFFWAGLSSRDRHHETDPE